MRTYITLVLLSLCLSVTAQTNITGYEYWFDQDTAHLTKTAITATPAPFLSVNLPTQNLAFGQHVLYIRLKDATGSYSAPVYRLFNVQDTTSIYLTGLRYWTDTLNNPPTDIRTLTLPNRTLTVDTNILVDYCAALTGAKRIYFQLIDNKSNYSSVVYRDAYTTQGAPLAFNITMHDDTLFAPSYWGLQWFYSNGTPASSTMTGNLLHLIEDSSYYAVISNTCGHTASSDTLTYRVNHTGLQNQLTDNGIAIYPNPTKGRLTVQFSQPPNSPTTLMLTNALGETIETTAISEQRMTISLAVSAGIYTATIKNSDINYVRKIVVE